jgi:hypothetical protein
VRLGEADAEAQAANTLRELLDAIERGDLKGSPTLRAHLAAAADLLERGVHPKQIDGDQPPT